MGLGAAGIKNHDGSMLGDELGAPPPGIGELSSASASKLEPYPARAFVRLGLAELAGIVLAIAFFFGKQDPLSQVCIATLVGGPFLAFCVIGLFSLVGYRARTFVGADGLAIVRGRRVRVIAFTDVGTMTSEVGVATQSGDSFGDLYCRLRVTDRRGRIVLDIKDSVMTSARTMSLGDADFLEARLQRAPTASGCHFIRRAGEAWIAWQGRRDAAA